MQRLAVWVKLSHVRGFVFASGGMGALIRRDVVSHPVLVAGRHEELASIMFRRRHHGTMMTRDGAEALIDLALADPTPSGCSWRCAEDNIASSRFARKLGFRTYATAPDCVWKGRAWMSCFFHVDRQTHSKKAPIAAPFRAKLKYEINETRALSDVDLESSYSGATLLYARH